MNHEAPLVTLDVLGFPITFNLSNILMISVTVLIVSYWLFSQRVIYLSKIQQGSKTLWNGLWTL